MGKGKQALIRSERIRLRKGNQQDGARRERERAKCNRAKGTHLRRLQREDTSAHRKKRPYEGHSQAGDNRVREGMLNSSV